MALFFIKRPVFAWVLAIFIVFLGILSIKSLPLEQYPDIAPPRVSIAATYNGASAQTVNDSVVQVIEQQLKGLDRLMYMNSTSDSAGRARTTGGPKVHRPAGRETGRGTGLLRSRR